MKQMGVKLQLKSEVLRRQEFQIGVSFWWLPTFKGRLPVIDLIFRFIFMKSPDSLLLVGINQFISEFFFRLRQKLEIHFRESVHSLKVQNQFQNSWAF